MERISSNATPPSVFLAAGAYIEVYGERKLPRAKLLL